MPSWLPKKNPTLSVAEQISAITRYAEFKQLIYKITALQQEKGLRSLAILSSLQGEGKTLFCAALALGYAEICQSRVLVVDTTTFHHPNSLVLRECLGASNAMIDFLPLEKGKLTTHSATRLIPSSPEDLEKALAPADQNRGEVAMTETSDHSRVRQAAEEGSKHHDLVLLDTVSLTAKNRNNIDPMLVARLADASLLVVSRKLLKSAKLSEPLRLLEDPALHLMGVIDNEESSL